MDIQNIGRYEVIKELGSGGMATVLLAKDSFMEREVAIKLLPRLFMHDPTFKERFQREAKLLARLEHSAIVPVYDFGYHEEQPYMVSRYMRGGSLLSLIKKEGAFSVQKSLAIASRICEGLSIAHKRGIVHRDLKPDNILFDDSGKAFIADFGIAKLAQSTSTLTGNALIGTPAYMSPEQFSGDIEIDGRSDQYCLAIILFEMISGELPFKGDTTAKLMKSHLMDAPPSLRALRSDLPESVEPVIRKALQKKPGDRFATIEAFQNALAAAVNGEPWVSKAAPAFPSASKPDEIPPVKEIAESEQDQSGTGQEDIYATNIFPSELPEISKSKKPSRKNKQVFGYLLRIVGLILLETAVFVIIGLGIWWAYTELGGADLFSAILGLLGGKQIV